MEDGISVTSEQRAETAKDTSGSLEATCNGQTINVPGETDKKASEDCPGDTAGDQKMVTVETALSAASRTMESCSDVLIKTEPGSQEDESTLMEYRSAGTDCKDCPSDADIEDSSTSSDSSSDDEEKDTTDTKINKALSHGRDASPEEIRRVQLNRHGFEDIRTKGELLPEELPPLEELTITVDEKVDMMYVGKITSIVGVLVIIQSSSDIPPLNDDTILFLEGHKVLGQVFEIFGPVKTPWYSVRFNDPENIKTKEITVGLPVFCAPKEDCFTRYVFVDSLKQMKGSDASWEDNNEPPEKYVEFSDDEAERHAKAKKKSKRTTQGENGGENMEKRNKNEYNQQERQNQYERPTRGHYEGGNPRFSHARGRGNPFQGQNQQPMRPRFASGQNSQPDSRWSSNNRFNGPRWHPGMQKRGNNSNDRNEPEFTAERLTNFGGPPRFTAGPQFNRNIPRSQFQPQSQFFGNGMVNNGSANSNNWNQFSQNVFSNNQGPRFTSNTIPFPQQNISPFPYQERLSTPPPAPRPPPPAPSPSSACQFTPVQMQPNAFTNAPGPTGFPQAQTNLTPGGFPQNMTNMVRNQGQPVSNLPCQPQPNAMTSQLCPVPANMVPPNATVYIPVSQVIGAQSSTGAVQNFGAPPNTQTMGSFSNNNSANPPFQQGSQSLCMNTLASGQFNPCVPPPQINNSQNGVPTISAPAQPSNFINSAMLYQSGVQQTNTPSNSFQSPSPNSNNQLQNNMVSGLRANSNMNPMMGQTVQNQLPVNASQNQQPQSRSEMTAGIQQTGRQQQFNTGSQQNDSVGGAGKQQGGQPQKAPETAASHTLPFQDAKFLHKMISAGLSNSAQIMDHRLMQND